MFGNTRLRQALPHCVRRCLPQATASTGCHPNRVVAGQSVEHFLMDRSATVLISNHLSFTRPFPGRDRGRAMRACWVVPGAQGLGATRHEHSASARRLLQDVWPRRASLRKHVTNETSCRKALPQPVRVPSITRAVATCGPRKLDCESPAGSGRLAARVQSFPPVLVVAPPRNTFQVKARSAKLRNTTLVSPTSAPCTIRMEHDANGPHGPRNCAWRQLRMIDHTSVTRSPERTCACDGRHAPVELTSSAHA